jgi:pyruvate/2-oxoglutarate/acetoin dehydrogenase E1 component
VVRTVYGGSAHLGPPPSQSPESWFVNLPGIKIVMPSTPADYKKSLKASIRDDPVIFPEHKMRYDVTGPEPLKDHEVPLCRTERKRARSS